MIGLSYPTQVEKVSANAVRKAPEGFRVTLCQIKSFQRLLVRRRHHISPTGVIFQTKVRLLVPLLSTNETV